MDLNSVAAVRRSGNVLGSVFGGTILALAMVTTFVGLMLVIVLPLERLRPDVRAACESAFAEFVSAKDLVSLERARISLRALDCDLRHRLIRHWIKSGI
jgi:uncharacterized membrane protein YccF (DUF307 family)